MPLINLDVKQVIIYFGKTTVCISLYPKYFFQDYFVSVRCSNLIFLVSIRLVLKMVFKVPKICMI